MDLFNALVKRTLTVPAILPVESHGDSSIIARQLDTALMSVGFKASKELLTYITNANTVDAKQYCADIIQAFKELKGDNVKHNVYFIDFPKNVPDTLTFWTDCIIDALNSNQALLVAAQLEFGCVNLLDLPKYGKYLHSYEEMLGHHDTFVDGVDKVIIHLGKSLSESANDVFKSFCGSNVPLKETDRDLLVFLAEICDDVVDIPVRENKAIVNAARFRVGKPVVANTATDFLRLAVALSDGDVTLETNSKFKSFSRANRRAFLSQLNLIERFDDVLEYAEQWKRLGELLHVKEYNFGNAQFAFSIARNETSVKTFNSVLDTAFTNNVNIALNILHDRPGYLIRNVNRLLENDASTMYVLSAIQTALPDVNMRVILSFRQYLQNRNKDFDARIFVGKSGKAWVAPDNRKPVNDYVVKELLQIVDNEVFGRVNKNYVYDPAILDLALPLSGKSLSDGYNIYPRGTIQSVDEGILRFFCYWKESGSRTDFDLSALLLDENFIMSGQISYTNLREFGGVHSGDITSAPHGASEFIDIELSKVRAQYVVPQVNVYSGESFTQVEESYFGYMFRTPEQKGKPFEAATVKNKSDVRGNGNIALPVVFYKDVDGWKAKWTHLFQKGYPQFNRIENNKISTALLMKNIVNYDYLNVGYLLQNAKEYDGSVTQDTVYVGLNVPEDLPKGTKTITLSNLHELI